MRHDSPAAYRTPHLATPYRRGGRYGRPRATTRVAPTAFYEAERNLYLDLLHRSVKKICLRQIFSVGRSGFAARRGLRRRQGYTSICSIR